MPRFDVGLQLMRLQLGETSWESCLAKCIKAKQTLATQPITAPQNFSFNFTLGGKNNPHLLLIYLYDATKTAVCVFTLKYIELGNTTYLDFFTCNHNYSLKFIF